MNRCCFRCRPRCSSQSTTLQTDQHWAAATSQHPTLATNPDGSVDIHFGPKAPAGKESDWGQAVSGKGWNTLLRLSGPRWPWFAKTWHPSEIKEL